MYLCNWFWLLMVVLCDVDVMLFYVVCMEVLLVVGVGVWDVIGCCECVGSLDVLIVCGSEVVNVLLVLIDMLLVLCVICCNGGMVYCVFLWYIVLLLLVWV